MRVGGRVGRHNNVKNRMISMRVTEEQFQYLETMAKRIKKNTGFRVTRASIILKLMEYGYPFLDREFPEPEQPQSDEIRY